MNVELTLIKGIVADLPDADQERIKECADKLRGILVEYGKHAGVALPMIVAEMDIKK